MRRDASTALEVAQTGIHDRELDDLPVGSSRGVAGAQRDVVLPELRAGGEPTELVAVLEREPDRRLADFVRSGLAVGIGRRQVAREQSAGLDDLIARAGPGKDRSVVIGHGAEVQIVVARRVVGAPPEGDVRAVPGEAGELSAAVRAEESYVGPLRR